MNWLRRWWFGCQHENLHCAHLAGYADGRKQEIEVNVYCPDCGYYKYGAKCESPVYFGLLRYRDRAQTKIAELGELEC